MLNALRLITLAWCVASYPYIVWHYDCQKTKFHSTTPIPMLRAPNNGMVRSPGKIDIGSASHRLCHGCSSEGCGRNRKWWWHPSDGKVNSGCIALTCMYSCIQMQYPCLPGYNDRREWLWHRAELAKMTCPVATSIAMITSKARFFAAVKIDDNTLLLVVPVSEKICPSPSDVREIRQISVQKMSELCCVWKLSEG